MVTAVLEPPKIKPRLAIVKPKPKPHIIRPTDEEHQKWEKFRELGQELHLPVFKFMWKIKNRDGDGNLLHDFEFYSRTWHRNAYNYLASQMMSKNGDGSSFIGGEISITNTAGLHQTGARGIGIGYLPSGSSSIPNSTNENPGGAGFLGASGVDTQGIVVGSGTTAENFDDFALDVQINDGTGTGQLSHVEQEAIAENYVGGTLTYTVTHRRFFNNNSGGNIDVNEVGIYAQGRAGNGSGVLFMVVRDVLGSTVTVPDTGQLDASYDISLVFLA